MLSTVLKMPGKSTAAASSLTGYKASLATATLTLSNLSWAFNLFAEVQDREHDYFTESFLCTTSTDPQDLKPVYSVFWEKKNHSLTMSGSVSMLKQKETKAFVLSLRYSMQVQLLDNLWIYDQFRRGSCRRSNTNLQCSSMGSLLSTHTC